MGRADNVSHNTGHYTLTPGPPGHVVRDHTWPHTATGYGLVSGARGLFFTRHAVSVFLPRLDILVSTYPAKHSIVTTLTVKPLKQICYYCLRAVVNLFVMQGEGNL